MSRVTEVMHKLATKFQPDQAGDLHANFQIDIEDGTPWVICIADGCCEVIAGEHDDPDVTLIMDGDTFVDIIDGELGGTSAFFSGRLRAEGNVMLATRLGSLFKR
ncbi:SCP2 sterol-binding domain-containing protein [Motiliproteus sediminis]|uniref:SCP2 sterol-binding domain-containing protein n=1 Tax=Motiliproteus sediminis TaxID=1468178 RepID=UPI001AEFC912|nr:SCP2 sterol-binding domain-containing protein [Motiliproteus sediminis]